MQSLGSFIPQEQRREWIESKITVGAVFKAFIYSFNPPKEKFIYIIWVSEDRKKIGFLTINTDINENFFPTPELRALHIPMSKDDSNLVDKDCFINCTEIKEYEAAHLLAGVDDNLSWYRGQSSDAELSFVRSFIRTEVHTISEAEKDFYGLL